MHKTRMEMVDDLYNYATGECENSELCDLILDIVYHLIGLDIDVNITKRWDEKKASIINEDMFWIAKLLWDKYCNK